MPEQLSKIQKRDYGAQGFVSPISIFTEPEVLALRSHFEHFETEHGGRTSAAAVRSDLHLLERWAWDVVNHPKIVGAVTSVLGPDVLLWSTNWFIKEACDDKFVSPHQDANYWGLTPHDVCTAWLALSDATPDTGPMYFLPGSHHAAVLEHENTYAEQNLLSRGQVVKTPVDPSQCLLAPLTAGQMSLHHVRVIHGSGPNLTDDRRIGMVLRYCATNVRQTKGPDTAVLVAGEDRYGHFELLPPPVVDNGEIERHRHQRAVTQLGRIIMGDD